MQNIKKQEKSGRRPETTVSSKKQARLRGAKLFCAMLALLVLSGAFFAAMGEEKSVMAADSGELRGVWVATVLKLNYPSQMTTDPDMLKQDAIRILDNAKEMGFNAVFFQVRPASDAFYRSDIFPWSRYLTGTQGVAPADGFDPLQFMVEEAHRRGLELHAWLNPYRITAEAEDNARLAENHPAKQHPAWAITHSDGRMYWNPGEPGAQQIIAGGVQEIVDRYDVDGIHIDDYFYPGTDFDDSAAKAVYGADYSSLADWRRANTETTVRNMYNIVHNSGKKMVFGVSPVGIWANKSTTSLGSDTRGHEAYTQKYADTRGWVKNGIVDYIAPQIYWNIGFDVADYARLVSWWSDVVRDTNVKLYIGQAAYRVGSSSDPNHVWSAAQGVEEIRRQIALNRSTPEVDGYIMYSYQAFVNQPGLASLMKEVNSVAAETPISVTPPSENPHAATPETPQQIWRFSDIAGHWGAKAITDLADQGVIQGDAQGRALPDQKIKRADFVLMLTRMLGIQPGTGRISFDDVDADLYYAPILATAKEMGLISGIGDNLFQPEAQLNRQDLFTMTWRALIAQGRMEAGTGTGALDGFADGAAVADYAAIPVATFIDKKIVTGADGFLNPLTPATRAETAAVLYRISASPGDEE